MTTENMSRTEARNLRSFCLAALENMAVKRSHPAFKVGEKVWILLPGRVEEATVKSEGRPAPMGGLQYSISYSEGSGVWAGRDLVRKAA